MFDEIIAGFLNNIDEFDGDQETMDNFLQIIRSLKYNTELVKEFKKEFKISGITKNDLIADRVKFLAGMEASQEQIINDSAEELKLYKTQAIEALKDSFVSILDNIIEGYDRIAIEVAIQLNENATMPTYAHPGDAGFDFYLSEDLEIAPGETKIGKTGIQMRVPMGYELQVRPRSGLSFKSALRIANAPGTIDNGYSDEIGIICWNAGTEVLKFKKGDRIAQGVFNEVPKARFIQIDNIKQSMENEDRQGGFGSTGI